MDLPTIGSLASIVALFPFAIAGCSWAYRQTSGRRVLGLARREPLDVVVTTSAVTLSRLGPRVRRPTTGHGQIQGLAHSARAVGRLYHGKDVRVLMSEQLVEPLEHDLVILGGLAGNTVAQEFVDRLQSCYGEEVVHFSDVGSLDVCIPGCSVSGYDLRIDSGGFVARDLGLIVVWRNPFVSQWRRAILCIGFSSYGTAEAARWVFSNVVAPPTRGWRRVDADVRMLRKASRKKRCWLAIVEFSFTTGGSHVPLAAPTLLGTAIIGPVREEPSARPDGGGVRPTPG